MTFFWPQKQVVFDIYVMRDDEDGHQELLLVKCIRLLLLELWTTKL